MICFTFTEDKAEYLDMARELISIWADYAEQQKNGTSNGSQHKKCRAQLEQLYTKLVEWLTDHANSPLVLLLASIATSALGKAPIELRCHFGLGIVEHCIAAYFRRKQW